MALNTNHAHREDETRHFINPQSGDKAERKSAAFGFTAVFVLFAKINNIYAFAHEQTYRNLAQLCGATNRYVAKTYNVPVKTVEKWRSGYSNPAIYILNLLAADMLTQ